MLPESQSESQTREFGDADLLQTWYRFACHQPGYIGFVLRRHRVQYVQTQEQQRAQLGILSPACARVWIHLQGMPLPRDGADFEQDIFRIVNNRDIMAQIGFW